MTVLDNVTVLVGNLTEDPELRYTPAGVAVANLRLAVNRRVRDGEQWRDELDGYFTVNVWRAYAEHVAESLRNGDRVVVVGRVWIRSYDKDGTTRYVTEILAEEIAPSLRWATAHVRRTSSRPTTGTSVPEAAASDDNMPF